MTVCVYHNGKLAADSLVTLGNIAGDGKVTKIGMIYEDLVSGERSTDKDSLQFPVDFAMYAVSGAVRHFSRFLRWFISVDHAGIDHNESITIEDPEDIEDPIEIMVVFKKHDIVRVYDSDYTRDLFVDLPKEGVIHTVGSGGVIAQAILTYDPTADVEDVIKAVTKVDIYCGGDPSCLSFSEDPEYDQDELTKAKQKHDAQVTEQVVQQLKDAGIDVKVVEKTTEPEVVSEVKAPVFYSH